VTALSLWFRLTLVWDTGATTLELSPLTAGVYDYGAAESVEYTPCLVTYDGTAAFESRVEASIRLAP
jgi:hypothetical protein